MPKSALDILKEFRSSGLSASSRLPISKQEEREWTELVNLGWLDRCRKYGQTYYYITPQGTQVVFNSRRKGRG